MDKTLKNGLSRRKLLKSIPLVMMSPMALALSGCSESAKPLQLGVQPWIGFEPFYIAKEQHLLPDTLKIVEFANQTKKTAAMMAGDLDAMALSLDEVFLFRAQGIALTVIAVLDVSAGADVVIAKRDKNGRSSMKPGVRLAYEPNSVGQLMLMMTLNKLGLQKDEVTLVPLAVGEPQQQAWLNNQIDAAITYEPYASKLLRMGCQVHLTSRDLPRYIYDVLAVRSELIVQSPAQVQQLTDTYYHALEHFVVYQDDSLYRIATRQKLSYAEAQKALQGIVIPGKQQNARLLKPHSEFEAALKAVNRLLFEEGILATPDTLKNIWSNQFL